MRLSADGLALLKRFEGFRTTRYLDAAGVPTIGYGHAIRPHETWVAPIDEHMATMLLGNDVRIAEMAVKRLIVLPLLQHQFDALVSFTYNLGGATLQRSTLRRVINRAAFEEVPGQWVRYVFAGGKKLPGLLRRRQSELAFFMASEIN